MLDFLVTILLVSLFVLGLFWLVQWFLSFFPWLKSDRLNPPVGKWWIILLWIVFWLNTVGELLNSGGPSEWTKVDYLNALYLCAFSYMIVYSWKSMTKPTKDSTKIDVSEVGSEYQP